MHLLNSILSWRKNQVVGADIDMAQAIADELGVKLEISSMSFDNVLTSLQTGKADLRLQELALLMRERSIWFSIPYYENKISFLVRKSDVEKYKDLTSLESANIAAQKGLFQNLWSRNNCQKHSWLP